MRKIYKKPEFVMSYFNFGNDIMLSSATPETLFTKGVRIDTIKANLNSSWGNENEEIYINYFRLYYGYIVNGYACFGLC